MEWARYFVGVGDYSLRSGPLESSLRPLAPPPHERAARQASVSFAQRPVYIAKHFLAGLPVIVYRVVF